MEETSTAKRHSHAVMHHDRGLLAIGALKLVEAVFFFLVGVGVIHFIHRDLGDAAVRLAEHLRMNLHSRLMSWVLDHLDNVTPHRMKQIGVVTFLYASLRVAEGVGLIMERLWAEYLTVGATMSLLPWEMYEIVRRPDWFRVCLLLVNIAVLAYLIWLMGRNRRSGKLV